MSGLDVCNVTPMSANLESLGGSFAFFGGADNDEINLFDTNNTFDDALMMNGSMVSLMPLAA